MKQLFILFLLAGILIPASLEGKRIKKCKLDRRPFTERKADFVKIRTYNSKFTESNGRLGADQVAYSGWNINVNYSPLSDFIGISRALIQDNAPFGKGIRAERPTYSMGQFCRIHPSFDPDVVHATQRDFTAFWEIRGNRLYLKDIKLRTPENTLYWLRNRIGENESRKRFFDMNGVDPIDPGVVHPDSIKLPKPELLVRLQQAIGRKFNEEGLIFADWFTGELIGEASLTSTALTPPDREAFLIRIEKGIVQEVQHKELIEIWTYYSHLFFIEAEKTFYP